MFSYAPSLDAAQLAALLASRICHDLISPVGAINNALELYDDDETMQQEALQLIRVSAQAASSRLQFARLAFGASGSAHFDIDSGDAQKVAELYMTQEKADLVWQGERVLLPKNDIKLLLNLLLVAVSTLPRGGVVDVALTSGDGGVNFTLTTQSQFVRLPQKFIEILEHFPKSGNRFSDKNCGEKQTVETQISDFIKSHSALKSSPSKQEIDAHSIQFYYTCLLADLAERTIDCHNEMEKVIFTA